MDRGNPPAIQFPNELFSSDSLSRTKKKKEIQQLLREIQDDLTDETLCLEELRITRDQEVNQRIPVGPAVKTVEIEYTITE